MRVAAHPAQVVNLSLLGGLVELEQEFNPGTILPVEIGIGSRSTVLQALVRRSEPTCTLAAGVDPEIRYLVALEFLREPRTDTSLLEELVTLLYYDRWVDEQAGRA